MKFRNKGEKGIIIVSCVATVIVVLGFTMMQGSVKKKEDNYVSKPIEAQISKNDYEIINKKEEKNKEILVVLEKRKLTSDELATLTNELIKDKNKNFEIYIFDKKEKAKDFKYENNQIQTLIKPKDKNSIEILKYNTVEKDIESQPESYEIESIKQEQEKTKIEINIGKVEDPEKALAQIKLLGESIKNINPNKDMHNLEITAYFNDNKNNSWKYISDNKNVIIYSETIIL